jgi:hypothetical protein
MDKVLATALMEMVTVQFDNALGSDNIIKVVDFIMQQLKEYTMNGSCKKATLLEAFKMLAEELNGEVLLEEVSDMVEQLYEMGKSKYKKGKGCCLCRFLCCCRSGRKQ